MKNTLLICFVMISFISLAQNSKIGIKIGANISNQLDSDYPSQGELVRFHAGISTNFKISERLSIQPELLYSQKGIQFSGGFTRLDYIETPVFLGIQIKKFTILTGPYYSNQVWLKVEDDYYSLKRNEFAPNIGLALGFEFKLTDHFLIGARYQRDVFYSRISTGPYPSQVVVANGRQDPSVPNNNIGAGKTRVMQSYLTFYF